MSEYKVKLSEAVEIPPHDELVCGGYINTDIITLASAGEYVRGEVLMSGDNGFVPATAEGIAGASEVCLLCSDVILPEGSTYDGAEGYFTGRFLGSSVIIPYEGEDDDHAELIENLRPVLRRHGIFIE